MSAPATATKVQQPAAAAKQAQQAAAETAGGADPGIDDDLQVSPYVVCVFQTLCIVGPHDWPSKNGQRLLSLATEG